MKKKVVATIGGLLAVMALSAWAFVNFFHGTSRDKISYQSAVAKQRNIVSTIVADGRVAFDLEVAISSEVIARVDDIRVHPGDSVKKGQILVILDDKQVRAQVSQKEFSFNASTSEVSQAFLALELANAKLRRLTPLADKHYVSADEFEVQREEARAAEQTYKASIATAQLAKASLQESQELLRKTVIRSPIEGTVLSVDTTVGETAVPSTQSFAGTALVRVAQMDNLLVKAGISEADVNRIRVGAQAKIYFPALNGDQIEARLERIALATSTSSDSGGLDQDSKKGPVTFQAIFALENAPSGVIRTGMSCRVELLRKNKDLNMASVPVEAIRAISSGAGNEFVVWKISTEGVIRPVKVKLGLADDNFQEVSGLVAGDRVVTGPSAFLAQLQGHSKGGIDNDGEPSN